jgi:hypothetical protein
MGGWTAAAATVAVVCAACQKTTEPVPSTPQALASVDAAAPDAAPNDLEDVRAALRASDQKPVEIQSGRVQCPGQLKLKPVTVRACLRVWASPTVRVILGDGDADVVCVMPGDAITLTCKGTGEASFVVGRLP